LEEEHTQAPAKTASKVAKPEEVNDLVERRSRKTKEQREEEKNSKISFFIYNFYSYFISIQTHHFISIFLFLIYRTKGSRRKEKRTSKTIGREKETRGIVEI